MPRGSAKLQRRKLLFGDYVNAPLAECERRDTKGLYRKARSGEIPNFTGISSPYEPPLHPDVELDSVNTGVEDCVDRLLNALPAGGAGSQ